MADTVKISGLPEITSGSLVDGAVVPVVVGGSTQKLPMSKLKTFLGDTFTTDAELSSQISTVNSSINGLTTTDVAEGDNLYYTTDRVDGRINALDIVSESAQIDLTATTNYITGIKTRLNTEDVISSSAQITNLGFGAGSSIPNGTISSSAQITAFGFISGAVDGVPDGTVSSSAQISDFNTFVENSVTSSMTVLSASYALTASYAENAGAGGGGGLTSAEVINEVNIYGLNRISGSVPTSSITNFPTEVSRSAALFGFGEGGGGIGGGSTDYVSNVTFAGTTLTFTGVGSGFNNTVDLSGESLATTTDIAGFLAVSTYTTDSSSFASRIDAAGGGGGGDVTIPDGTVSSSAQTIQHINTVGVISSSAQVDGAQIDLSTLTTDDVSEGVTNRYYANSLVLPYLNQLQVLSGSAGGGGFSVSGTNIVSSSQQISNLTFVLQSALDASASALQANIDGIQGVNLVDENDFTATQKFRDIQVTGSVLLTNGSFSGSGAQLFGIPSSAIIGTVAVEASSLSDGDNSITANSVIGITINTPSGSILANGDIVIQSGSIISGSGAGLFNIPGSAIIGGVGGGTSIASGSVTASVDPTDGLVVTGDISASGDITARSISVGTSGTPTIYSDNNLNLSASNAVVITDSPLRLNPFTDTETGSFSLSNGDLVYNSTNHKFYGYANGNWVSLIETGSGDGGGAVDLGGTGIISSSAGIVNLGAGIVSSSIQVTNKNTSTGEIFFASPVSAISSSNTLTYNVVTDLLSAGNIFTGDITYVGTLSGNADSSGSFGRLIADSVLINDIYELPTSDGTANQVMTTDGNGAVTFGNVDYGNLVNVPNFIVSSSLQLPATLVNNDVANTFENSQFISGNLYVTESVFADVLTLPQRDTKPANPVSGSIIVSASGATIKPFFWDGNQWNALY